MNDYEKLINDLEAQGEITEGLAMLLRLMAQDVGSVRAEVRPLTKSHNEALNAKSARETP